MWPYVPKLKRNEPVWAQADAEVGPALWEKTEELLGGLIASAGQDRPTGVRSGRVD